MRTCYLHVGMPKTGSSAIQERFYGYDDGALAYARIKQKNHELALGLSYARNPATLPILRRREIAGVERKLRVEAARLELRRALGGRKSVILSAEAVLDQLDPDEIAAMVADLASRFDRLMVIGYVRPLGSLTASQLQQRIKQGQRRFKLPAPRYRKRFEPIFESAGRDNVTLIRFHRDDLVGGDVVQDFAHRLGLDRAPGGEAEANPSLSAEAVGALYAFNKYTGPLLAPRERTRMLNQMIEAFRGVEGVRFALAPELIEAHIADHAEDIAWMENLCGFDVTGTVSDADDPVRSEADLLARADACAAERAKAFQKTRRNPSAE